jgi:hypothetical protein
MRKVEEYYHALMTLNGLQCSKQRSVSSQALNATGSVVATS